MSHWYKTFIKIAIVFLLTYPLSAVDGRCYDSADVVHEFVKSKVFKLLMCCSHCSI